MYIGAIADDLTGATDLSLTFSREGMRVLQVVGVPDAKFDFGDADIVVVSLKSRTIPAAEAIALSVAGAQVLLAGGAQQLFFKYCSTFDSTDKGNIGPVIDALLELLGETRTVACPAFPTNKRTLFKGHLFVGDLLLSDSSMKNHPLTPMHDANLVRVLQRQTSTPVSLIARDVVAGSVGQLEQAFAELRGIAIVDAITDDDLRAIGRAAKTMRLITGGSGVALGLPANFTGRHAAVAHTQAVHVPSGGAVILAGSCSSATRRQVAAAIAAGTPSFQLDAFAIAEHRMTVEDVVTFVLSHREGNPPLVYSSANPAVIASVQDKLGRDASGALVEDFLAAVAGRLHENGFNKFLVAGGETSGAVVGALGITALQIGPEIDPGVPWTRSHGDDCPVALALKSGNFGSDDFFLKAWELVR
ncbi:3-oxo-tetronate kinase [Devosia naphthalenivorans]|uniref:3-oxo-tetronate kinase n=1 Tax=Devosia naphthalenivorans TaxID=2082392 RepID=UPI000D34F4E5|nr:3-oxo-tetronate kinase [Devosia naphthalenivorans]